MAEPLRPISYDGVLWGLDSSGPVYLELREGFDSSADTSGQDDTPVGGIGLFERNHVARTRRIRLVGHIRGVGSTDVDRAAFYEFHANRMRTNFEEGVTKVLSMDLPDGTTAVINARTEAREFEKLNGWAGTVLIELISVDPHWVVT